MKRENSLTSRLLGRIEHLKATNREDQENSAQELHQERIHLQETRELLPEDVLEELSNVQVFKRNAVTQQPMPYMDFSKPRRAHEDEFSDTEYVKCAHQEELRNAIFESIDRMRLATKDTRSQQVQYGGLDEVRPDKASLTLKSFGASKYKSVYAQDPLARARLGRQVKERTNANNEVGDSMKQSRAGGKRSKGGKGRSQLYDETARRDMAVRDTTLDHFVAHYEQANEAYGTDAELFIDKYEKRIIQRMEALGPSYRSDYIEKFVAPFDIKMKRIGSAPVRVIKRPTSGLNPARMVFDRRLTNEYRNLALSGAYFCA
eukprot:Clim_evm16s234 gene=Clim_evmTU16s234